MIRLDRPMLQFSAVQDENVADGPDREDPVRSCGEMMRDVRVRTWVHGRSKRRDSPIRSV